MADQERGRDFSQIGGNASQPDMVGQQMDLSSFETSGANVPFPSFGAGNVDSFFGTGGVIGGSFDVNSLGVEGANVFGADGSSFDVNSLGVEGANVFGADGSSFEPSANVPFGVDSLFGAGGDGGPGDAAEISNVPYSS